MTTLDLSANDDPAVDAAIAEYLLAVEAGQTPDLDAFLAQHSAIAEPLREFFADQARFHAAARHLAPPAVPNPGDAVRYFGDYELIEVLARGGMGIVWRARQRSLNRVVALKMILPGQRTSPLLVARLRLEAESAANLDHPHIVPIHEVGEWHGQHYFSMKLIDGQSLAHHIPPNGCPTKKEQQWAVALVRKVAEAVQHAHDRGILHRDLKPANILVKDGIPYVTDFGLAKALGGDANANTGAMDNAVTQAA